MAETKTDAFDRVYYHGQLMDKKTRAFLQAMEEELGYELTILQGSYNKGGVSASAGTHDGGGVVDLAPFDHAKKVRVARKLGGFAWFRPELPGVWGDHVHLGIRNHGQLSKAAQDQQAAYDADPPRNGLANNAVDKSWHPDPSVTFRYPPKKKPVVPKLTEVQKTRNSVVEAHGAVNAAIQALIAADDKRKKAKEQIDPLKEVREDLKDVLQSLPKK